MASEERFICDTIYLINKNNWEINYVPEILIQHRVDNKSRKNSKDFRLRMRRSLRSGWYLYFLFYPLKLIPKKFLYTLGMQFRTKVFNGDQKALGSILMAMFDLVINSPKVYKNSSRLTMEEYRKYSNLSETKIYWKPLSF